MSNEGGGKLENTSKDSKEKKNLKKGAHNFYGAAILYTQC